MATNTPPQTFENFNIPVLHKFCDFYKKIYFTSFKILKKDRFGIFMKIENSCLAIIEILTEARFENKIYKLKPLKLAHTKVETLKLLIRISWELQIIGDKKYIELENYLVEISKDINNWVNSLAQKEF